MARGKRASAGAGFDSGTFLAMVVFPTLLVMLVSGVWHGAGLQFVIWGLIHGVYLCINHGWRALSFVRKWRAGKRYHAAMGPIGFVITFLSVVVAMVFFGAPSASVAVHVLQGMIGLNGMELPAGALGFLGPLTGMLQGFGVTEAAWWHIQSFAQQMGIVVLFLGLAVLGPNTLQILQWESVGITSGKPSAAARVFGLLPALRWQYSFIWAGIVAVLAAAAIYRIGGPSEFLYWQF